MNKRTLFPYAAGMRSNNVDLAFKWNSTAFASANTYTKVQSATNANQL